MTNQLDLKHIRECAEKAAQGEIGQRLNALKHGASRGKSITYKIWVGMRKRCYTSTNSDYKNYGAKGISICPRWDSYPLFLEDMGERPPGKTLDRIDGTKGYSKENCRWATRAEQNRNTCVASTKTSSSFKGVYKRCQKWAASIRIERKLIHIGTFQTEKEAALAYNSEATKHFGEYAWLNKV